MYRGLEMLTLMDNKEYFDPGIYKMWITSRKSQQKEADVHKERVADRRRGGYEDGPINKKESIKSFIHQMNSTIEELNRTNLLPALFFVFSRKDCERYAKAVSHTLIDSSDAAAVRHIISFHLHHYKDLIEFHSIIQLLNS